MLSQSGSKSTTWILAGRHSRVGIVVLCQSTWSVRTAEAAFLLTALACPPPRFSQESRRACTGYFDHRIQLTASPMRLLAGYSELRRTGGSKLGHRWFLPDGCSVHAKRASPEIPDLSSHRCASPLRRRAAISPTRALPPDSSGQPPYEGARTFRRRSLPDDSSI